MNTPPRTSEWLYAGLLALPLIYFGLVYAQLPDIIPTHFNMEGQPDGYSSKRGFAIGSGALLLFMYLLLRYVPSLDPTQRLTDGVYGRIRLTVSLFLSGIFTFIVYIIHTGLTGSLTLDIILSATYLLLAGVGNIMLSVPQNYFVGIKTPWALASEANWRKTHRLAGKLWVMGGLLGFVLNLLIPDPAKVPLAVTIPFALAIIPYVYSYRLFKQGLAGLLLVLGTYLSAAAQTEQTLTYAITQPTTMTLTLEGTLTLPAEPRKPIPVVVLIAGSGPTDRDGNAPGASTPGASTPGTSMNMYRQLADSLTRRGVAVLRYDKRGSGKNLQALVSQLGKSELSFEYVVQDAVGFIRQLQADNRFSKVIVAGHSEGALVGVLAATQTSAAGYVSIAGVGQNIADVLKKQFADSGLQGDLLTLANSGLDSLRAGMRVRKPNPMLAAFFSPVNQPYLISWMQHDPARSLQAYKGPVLLIQGRNDIQVSVGEAERLKAARPDAQLLFVPTMNHVMKQASSNDRATNIASYTATGSAILPAVADAIAEFAKK
jgi:uncharacterized membrane protein/pimeloyl-ACP methyl ester carboxylesterase